MPASSTRLRWACLHACLIYPPQVGLPACLPTCLPPSPPLASGLTAFPHTPAAYIPSFLPPRRMFCGPHPSLPALCLSACLLVSPPLSSCLKLLLPQVTCHQVPATVHDCLCMPPSAPLPATAPCHRSLPPLPATAQAVCQRGLMPIRHYLAGNSSAILEEPPADASGPGGGEHTETGAEAEAGGVAGCSRCKELDEQMEKMGAWGGGGGCQAVGKLLLTRNKATCACGGHVRTRRAMQRCSCKYMIMKIIKGHSSKKHVSNQ